MTATEPDSPNAPSAKSAAGSQPDPGLTFDFKPEASFTATESGPANVVYSTTALADRPSEKDTLGFLPYVRAIAWLLLDATTEPPLTLSVEGSWGSGKSSFMLQLAGRLLDLHADRKAAAARHDALQGPGEIRCVWFNPWKNDKDESLWASFALALLRQLDMGTPFWRRLWAQVSLTWSRVEWPRLVIPAISLLIFMSLTIGLAAKALLTKGGGAHDLGALTSNWKVIGSASAALVSAAAGARHLVGNPLPKTLANYIRNPKFEDRVSLIERFSREFTNIQHAHVGPNGRIFVFIDDLDRCEVPRAAELMQAINLLMSVDATQAVCQPRTSKKTGPAPPASSNLVFILGIDREMVAAGIAAKNESVLPYLASGKPGAPGGTDPYRFGLEYGFAFLEKFIQVPFHVPALPRSAVDSWARSMTGSPSAEPAQQPAGAGADRGALMAGQDPETFESVVADIAGAFAFGPRRIKQFVNLYRLQIAIAIQTGALSVVSSEQPGGGGQGLTLQRLGLVTAIFLKWPSLVGRIFEDPTILDQGSGPSGDPVFREMGRIRHQLGWGYSLDEVDLAQFLAVLPDAYPNGDLQPGGSIRSQLGAGQGFTGSGRSGPNGGSFAPTGNAAASPDGGGDS